MGFPSELDEYVQESVAYTVGLPLSAKTLTERLLQAEEVQKDLRQQVHYLQQRLEDTQQRLDRTKAEANLNAQAVRKHVSESQKLAERYRTMSDECARLEGECALYLRDREVFMEAADEAEERAREAEERSMEAERKAERLARELDYLKQGMMQSAVSNSKMADELNSMRSKVKELESENHSLQNELASVKKHRDSCLVNGRIEKLEKENKELRLLLEAATSGNKEQSNELYVSKRDDKEDQIHWEDKILANSMVVSAITKGLRKVTEQEKEEAVTKARSNVEAVIRELGLELRSRLEASEKNVQLLIAEVQSLRQEKNHIKSNLEKAEVEVQLLDEENKELRLLLRSRHQVSDGHVASPYQAKVRASSSPKSQVKSPENIRDLIGNDRQPLTPIPHNPADSRVHHRQQLLHVQQ